MSSFKHPTCLPTRVINGRGRSAQPCASCLIYARCLLLTGLVMSFLFVTAHEGSALGCYVRVLSPVATSEPLPCVD